jgi:hypothetical protein
VARNNLVTFFFVVYNCDFVHQQGILRHVHFPFVIGCKEEISLNIVVADNLLHRLFRKYFLGFHLEVVLNNLDRFLNGPACRPLVILHHDLEWFNLGNPFSLCDIYYIEVDILTNFQLLYWGLIFLVLLCHLPIPQKVFVVIDFLSFADRGFNLLAFINSCLLLTLILGHSLLLNLVDRFLVGLFLLLVFQLVKFTGCEILLLNNSKHLVATVAQAKLVHLIVVYIVTEGVWLLAVHTLLRVIKGRQQLAFDGVQLDHTVFEA